MFILYDVIFTLGFILYLPYLVLKGKFHSGFSQRLGFFPRELINNITGYQNIWVHAVSVGETLAVAKLIEDLKAVYPRHQIVLSTTTKTGQQIARQRFNNVVVIYSPLDLSFIVRWFVKLISPKIYIAAETEIWPNLFLCLQKDQVPIIQVNGRVSDRAFKGYQSIGFLIKGIVGRVRMFCMQTEKDAEKIRQLGAQRNHVVVVGNLKFDDLRSVRELSQSDFEYQEKDEILIAGSTHPGEEKIILDIFKTISSEFPDLRLILAPRHTERAPEIVRLLEAEGYEAVKFSQIRGSKFTQKAVMVVDTIGQLRSLYSLAKVVFVGKSLIGQGGQNIIEPAIFAKPIVVGPHLENFEDVLNLFKAEAAIVQVADPEELLKEIRALLKNPQRMKLLGERARKVVSQNQGATKKIIDYISALMPIGS